SRRGHYSGLVVGLLRAGLGWLVVLGPGGKRLVHALAGGYGADPLAGGDREAWGVQELDRAAGDCRVLAEPAGYLPGAFRRADLGACLCRRPVAWRVHPDLPAVRGWWFAHPVRPARAGGQEPGRLCPMVTRDAVAGQQPGAGGGGRD